MAHKVDFQVGFSADEQSIATLRGKLAEIMDYGKINPLDGLSKGQKEAIENASILRTALQKSFNADLGVTNISKLNTELQKSGITLQQCRDSFRALGVNGADAYNLLGSQILSTNVKIKESNKLLDKMAVTMANTVRFGISSSIFNNMTGALSKAVGYVENLDKSLTDIRIVSGKGAEQMQDFAKYANEAAKGLGATTLDYTNASLIYYQQGLAEEEVQERTQVTLEMANVLGESASQVSDYMTAIWNNFDDGSQKLEYYGDVIAELGAKTASSAEEIAEGLSKFASVADTVGLSYEYATSALATVVAETRQSADVVGTAFKTLFARIQDLELGKTLDDGTSLGLYSQALEKVGISIKNQKGQLKDMDEILQDMGAKWQSLSKDQQVALAQNVAGTRQYTQLVALMDNWDEFNKNLDYATDATGTLQEQQEIYLESTESKLKKLKTTSQGLYSTLINKDDLNDGIDALTNLIDVFDNLLSSFGGGTKTLLGFGAVLSGVFSKQIANSVVTFKDNVKNAADNTELLKQKLEQIQAGTFKDLAGNSVVKNSPVSAGLQANYESQLANSQKIAEISGAISQEENNQLNDKQREIALLEQQIAKTRKIVELNLQRVDQSDFAAEVLGYTEEQLLMENIRLATDRDETEEKYKQAKAYETILTSTEKLYNSLTVQGREQKYINEELRKNIELKAKNLKVDERNIGIFKALFDDDVFTAKSSKGRPSSFEALGNGITHFLNGGNDSASYKKQLDGFKENQKAIDTLLEAEDLKKQADDLQRYVDNTVEAIKQNMLFAGSITTLTSSLALVSNAWMTLNGLISTWNNEDLSFGDKLAQTFMTLSMTIPMTISNLQNITKGIDNAKKGILAYVAAKEMANKVSQSTALVTEYENAVKDRTILLNKAMTAVITGAADAEELFDQTVIKAREAQALRNKLLEEGYDEKVIDALATKAQTAATEENTGAQNANNITYTEAIKRLKALTVAKIKETAADAASFVMKHKLIAIIAAVAVAIGSLLIKRYKDLQKQREQEIEILGKSISRHQELAKTYDEEANALGSLVTSYEAILKQRKEGSISTEEARQKVYDLCNQYDLERLKIQALTGDYSNLGKSMRDAQSEQYQNAADESKKAMSNSVEKAKLQIENKDKMFSFTSGDKVNFGITDLDESAFLNDSKYSDLIKRVYGQQGRVNGILDIEEILKRAATDDNFYAEMQNIAKTDGPEIAKRIVEILEENEEAITSYKESLENYEEATKNAISSDAVQKISDVKTYVDQVKAAAQEAVEKGIFEEDQIDEATNWAQKAIGQYDEVKDYINSGSAILMIETKLKEPDSPAAKAIIEKMYSGEISDELLAFLLVHLDVEEDGSVSESKVQALLDQGKAEADFLVNVHAVNNTQSVLDNIYANNGEISEEDVSSLVANKGFMDSIDLSEEAFKNMCETNTEYAVDLVERYFNSIADNIENAKAQLQSLKDQQAQLQTQKDETSTDLTLFSTDDYGKAQNTESTGLGVDEAAAAAEQAYANLQSFISDNKLDVSNIDELSEVLKKLYENTGELTPEEEKLFEVLKNATGISEEQVRSWGKAIKVSEDYADMESYLVNAIDESTKAMDTSLTKINEAHQAFLDANSAIDDLQKTYGSLKDIVDQYNEDSVLTIDNLQSLLAMTPEELSYLDIKEGKLSVNTERMKEDTIAKLESMKAAILTEAAEKLYTLALEENADTAAYNAIKQLYAKDAINGVKDAAENAAAALAEYNQATAAANSWTGERKALANAIEEDTQKRLALIDGTINGVKSGKISFDKAMGSSKTGSSKKDDKELVKDEIDAYHKWEQQIKACNNALDELQDRQDHLKGKQLIKNLEAQTAALREQTEAQKNLNGQYKAQAEYEKSRLMGYGVGAQFDSTGNISNYNQVLQNAQDQYNSVIKAYNASKTEANEKAVENAKNVYDDIKQTVSNYEAALEGMQKAQAEINKLMQSQADVALAKLEAEWDVELQIDTHDAERRIKKFIKDLNEDFTRATEDWKESFDNAFDSFSNGKLEQDINGQISKMSEIMSWMDDVQARSNADGEYEFAEGDMFTSASDAADYLLELEEDLEDMADDLKSAYEDAWNAYTEGIDQAIDEFDRLNDIIDKNIDRMEKYKEIMELSYNNANSSTNQIDFYSTQMSNQGAIADIKKQENEMWAEQFNEIAKQNGTAQLQFDVNGLIDQTKVNISEMDEAQKSMYDQMISNEEKILDSYVERAKLAKEIKDLQLEASTQAAAQAMFGTTDIDYRKQQWEDELKWQDRYYDGQERIYQLEALGNKYDTAIKDNKSLKVQEKLLKVKEQELKYLREKDNLSKDEIALAEKRYELTMAEIALEEAQNNKNTMKLTRNEEGNWSYQYVADEDDVANKQQDVIDKTYEYYEAAKEAYQNAVSYSFDIYETYTERYMEIMNNTALSEEERAARLEELNRNTSKSIAALGEETTSFVLDTTTATSLLVRESIESGNVAIEDLTAKQKELYQAANDANLVDLQETRGAMENENSLLKQQALSCLQETLTTFELDTGKAVMEWQNQSQVIQKALQDAAATGQKSISDYQREVAECAASIGLNLQKPQQSFAQIKVSTDQARIASQQYAQQTASGLGSARSQLMQIKSAWDQVKSAILQAVTQMQQYINRTQQAVMACNNLVAAQARADAAKAKSNSSSGGGTSSSSSLDNTSGSGTGRNYFVSYVDTTGQRRLQKNDLTLEEAQAFAANVNEAYRRAGRTALSATVSHYKTGGYTGEWSNGSEENNGRLAWLHQKELVLNEDDTKNILNAVNAIRDINANSIDEAILSNIFSAALNNLYDKIPNVPVNNNTNSESNTFNITAEFPNADDVEEIREAIMSLPNLASQYLARR